MATPNKLASALSRDPMARAQVTPRPIMGTPPAAQPQTPQPQQLVRLSPGVYRSPTGALVNSQGAMLPNQPSRSNAPQGIAQSGFGPKPPAQGPMHMGQKPPARFEGFGMPPQFNPYQGYQFDRNELDPRSPFAGAINPIYNFQNQPQMNYPTDNFQDFRPAVMNAAANLRNRMMGQQGGFYSQQPFNPSDQQWLQQTSQAQAFQPSWGNTGIVAPRNDVMNSRQLSPAELGMQPRY